MANTIREQIILAIIAKLANVTTSNGYNTNCGNNVERAKMGLSETDLPAFVVFPAPEESVKVHGRVKCIMPIRVEAEVLLEQNDNGSVESEKMLGDMRKLMESQTDEPTGGLADNIDYTAGGIDEYPGSGDNRAGCVAVFNVTYKTLAGDPYRQTRSSSSSSNSTSSSSSSSST